MHDRRPVGHRLAGLHKQMNRKRLLIRYSGQVQGVGFRFTVKCLARGFEVTGIVKNLMDGRVEMIAEGQKDELDAFRQEIQRSELGHFIRQEDVQWEEAKNEFRDFEIVH